MSKQINVALVTLGFSFVAIGCSGGGSPPIVPDGAVEIEPASTPASAPASMVAGTPVTSADFDGARTALLDGPLLQSTMSSRISLAGASASPDSPAGEPPVPGSVQWSQVHGGGGTQTTVALVADATGSPLVTGYFGGQLDLGCGAMDAIGTYDLFVAKYDTDGVCQWSKHAGALGQMNFASGIAVDAAGDAYVTGMFDGTTVFVGGEPLVSAGGLDGVVAKFSGTDGAYVWGRRLGGASDDSIYGVATAGTHVALTGSFSGTANLGGADLVSAGGADVFVAEYTAAAGVHEWSNRFGAAGYDNGNAVNFDSQLNVVIVGSFEGVIDFGGGPLTSAGGSDAFQATFSAGGSPTRSAAYGGVGTDSVTSVAIDGQDNVIVGGYFSASIDLGGGPFTSTARYTGFLAKYSAAGTYAWSRELGATTKTVPLAIGRDANDGIVITGYYEGSASLGGEAATPVAAAPTIFIAKYSSANTHEWSTSFAGTGAAFGRGIGASATGRVFVSGSFGTTIDYGAGAITGAGTKNIPFVCLAN